MPVTSSDYPGRNLSRSELRSSLHRILHPPCHQAKLPEALVYKITKLLSENVGRLADVVKDMKGVTVKDLALDIGVPFHPGALKYYKEAGVIK